MSLKCANPFFDCINSDSELKIVVDVCVKGENYSLCKECWGKIAESENDQWTATRTKQTENLTFTPEWKHQDTDTTQD